MSGITKCANTHCPLAESCYRKTAKDSGWQSYSEFQYVETWRSDTKERVFRCENYLGDLNGKIDH